MTLARVCGNVVSTKRSDAVAGARYLLVAPADPVGDVLERAIVALDTVGAGLDELVLVSQGSSARQTQATDKKAIDAVIIGIVDVVEASGSVAYKK